MSLGGNGKNISNVVRVLAQSAVPVSVTGTLVETTLASYTLKGGTLGPNSALRIAALWSFTNSANNKVIKVKFGATNYLVTVVTTQASAATEQIVRNRGNKTSQVGWANTVESAGTSGGAVITSAQNTDNDTVVSILGTLANVGETITLEAYTIEIIPG